MYLFTTRRRGGKGDLGRSLCIGGWGGWGKGAEGRCLFFVIPAENASPVIWYEVVALRKDSWVFGVICLSPGEERERESVCVCVGGEREREREREIPPLKL